MILLAAISWYVVSGLLEPLQRISKAAEIFGHGQHVDLLPVIGPSEVKDLTTEFNRMQRRLTRSMSDRTNMLAVMGHDLCSSLTAIRVKTELVGNEETRAILVTSVEEMQETIGTTLVFTRGLSQNEPVQNLDIRDLFSELKTKVNTPFELENGEDVQISVRPNAMRESLRFVIENAVRYGKSANVGWEVKDGEVHIRIEKVGPGIPGDLPENMLEPFERLEESQSLETAGHGLGYLIARSIVRSHGGDIKLTNRKNVGLQTIIHIPTSINEANNGDISF